MCVLGGGALELVCLAGVTDCLTFAALFIENVFFFPNCVEVDGGQNVLVRL